MRPVLADGDILTVYTVIVDWPCVYGPSEVKLVFPCKHELPLITISNMNPYFYTAHGCRRQRRGGFKQFKWMP